MLGPRFKRTGQAGGFETKRKKDTEKERRKRRKQMRQNVGSGMDGPVTGSPNLGREEAVS